MLGDDVLALIEGGGFGTAGTDLLLGAMPDSPDVCTVVTEYGGRGPTFVQGEALPTLEYPRIQLRTRGEALDYDTPREAMEALYQFFAGRAAEAVSGGARYLAWMPQQTPSTLGKDENERWVFVLNLEVWKELSSL